MRLDRVSPYQKRVSKGGRATLCGAAGGMVLKVDIQLKRRCRVVTLALDFENKAGAFILCRNIEA